MARQSGWGGRISAPVAVAAKGGRGFARAGRARLLRRGRAIPITEEMVADAAGTRVIAMTQTTNRLFDEFAKLMTDAAGVAQGVRREAETVVRSQAERFIGDLDLVKREDFDVVKDMVSKLRVENDELKARLSEVESKLIKLMSGGEKSPDGMTLIADVAGEGPAVG